MNFRDRYRKRAPYKAVQTVKRNPFTWLKKDKIRISESNYSLIFFTFTPSISK